MERAEAAIRQERDAGAGGQVMAETEAKTRRRKSRPPVVNGGKAAAEIDNRLADALKDRAVALHNASKLGYWQDRVRDLNQEINELIGFQQRLSGQASIPPAPGLAAYPPAAAPGGVITSAPVSNQDGRPSQAPSGVNVAEVVGGEGGFA